MRGILKDLVTRWGGKTLAGLLGALLLSAPALAAPAPAGGVSVQSMLQRRG